MKQVRGRGATLSEKVSARLVIWHTRRDCNHKYRERERRLTSIFEKNSIPPTRFRSSHNIIVYRLSLSSNKIECLRLSQDSGSCWLWWTDSPRYNIDKNNVATSTAGTHHFQMFEWRQDGLQFADDGHDLVAGQRLAAVQQVHHLVLETLHRARNRSRAAGEEPAVSVRDWLEKSAPYEEQRRDNADGAAVVLMRGRPCRYAERTVVVPCNRWRDWLKWRTRFGVGTMLRACGVVVRAECARGAPGRRPRSPFLLPTITRPLTTPEYWWGPGNANRFLIVFGGSEPVGISYRPSSPGGVGGH